MTFHQLFGTYRSRLPEETLSIIKPYIKLAGISRLADLTGLDDLGIPVYACFRPSSKSLATSQGKGCSHLLAQCSAYMEGIEHFYAENCLPALKDKTVLEIRNIDFVYPKELQAGPIMVADYESLKLDWIRGVNLLNQNKCYVPVEA